MKKKIKMWAIINKKSKEFVCWQNDKNEGVIVLPTRKRAMRWKNRQEKIVRIEIKILK